MPFAELRALALQWHLHTAAVADPGLHVPYPTEEGSERLELSFEVAVHKLAPGVPMRQIRVEG
jgi:hypothetical protein